MHELSFSDIGMQCLSNRKEANWAPVDIPISDENEGIDDRRLAILLSKEFSNQPALNKLKSSGNFIKLEMDVMYPEVFAIYTLKKRKNSFEILLNLVETLNRVLKIVKKIWMRSSAYLVFPDFSFLTLWTWRAWKIIGGFPVTFFCMTLIL